jgi:PEP-CTERM motif
MDWAAPDRPTRAGLAAAGAPALTAPEEIRRHSLTREGAASFHMVAPVTTQPAVAAAAVAAAFSAQAAAAGSPAAAAALVMNGGGEGALFPNPGGGGSYLADAFTNRILIAGVNSGDGSIQIARIPEPSTWAMTLAGFAGLGWLARLRSRKTKPA